MTNQKSFAQMNDQTTTTQSFDPAAAAMVASGTRAGLLPRSTLNRKCVPIGFPAMIFDTSSGEWTALP